MPQVEWYSWGSGGGGLLAQGTRDDHHTPTRIAAPPFASPPSSPSPAVTSVACSAVYSLACTSDGRLWECGDALQSLSTAAAGEAAALTFSPLLPSPLPFTQSVTSVSCGWSHCACLTSDGRLFTWGDNRFGQLGHPTPPSTSSPPSSFVRHPTLVPLPHPVTSIACGRRHSLALLSSSALMGWGEGKVGQLGQPSPALPSNCAFPLPSPAPLSVPTFPPFSYLIAVRCGWTFSLLLTSDGLVLASGSNHWNQCAAGDATRAVQQWQVVQGLPPVVEVACGWSHCLARDREGGVWVWGRRSMGQAGDGRPDDRTRTAGVTRVVLGGEGMRVRAVRCGSESCMAVDEEGGLWGWGWNEHGNLGGGGQEEQREGCVWTPRKVVLGSEEDGEQQVVTEVITGGASVFARVAVADPWPA